MLQTSLLCRLHRLTLWASTSVTARNNTTVVPLFLSRAPVRLCTGAIASAHRGRLVLSKRPLLSHTVKMSSASAAAPPAAAAEPHVAGQAQAQGGLEAGTSLRSESPPKPGKLRYITSLEAAQIDEVLMSPDGGAFSIDQLMELAGLSCAQVVHACYPPTQFPNVLVAAGPGNQGGDGLVAARHLSHFGYTVSVWYPKEGKTELFKVCSSNLVHYQLVSSTLPLLHSGSKSNYRTSESLSSKSMSSKTDWRDLTLFWTPSSVSVRRCIIIHAPQLGTRLRPACVHTSQAFRSRANRGNRSRSLSKLSRMRWVAP